MYMKFLSWGCFLLNLNSKYCAIWEYLKLRPNFNSVYGRPTLKAFKFSDCWVWKSLLQPTHFPYSGDGFQVYQNSNVFYVPRPWIRCRNFKHFLQNLFALITPFWKWKVICRECFVQLTRLSIFENELSMITMYIQSETWKISHLSICGAAMPLTYWRFVGTQKKIP